MSSVRLGEMALARSGEKGDVSNVLVIPYHGTDYDILHEELTVVQVRDAYAPLVDGEIERFEFPGQQMLNFVMKQALDGGSTRSLNLDPHGKSRGAIMEEIDVPIPENYAPPATVDGTKEWSR